MGRLTTDECRAIAEHKMRALKDLTAEHALARYGTRDGRGVIHDERDLSTGDLYRVRTSATRVGDMVSLSVAVDPLPKEHRRGPFGGWDALKYGRHLRRSTQTRELPLQA